MTRPLDALVPQLSLSDQRTLWEAQRKLIRACMAKKGLDFTFPSFESSQSKDEAQDKLSEQVSNPAAAFGNPEYAHAHGYGFNAAALAEFRAGHQGPETGQSLDDKTDAALYGAVNEPQDTVDLGGGRGKLSFGKTGCYADALDELYGDQRKWRTLSFTTNNLVGDLHHEIAADGAVSAALGQWRACMASHGWPSFDAQTDAYSRVFKAYYTHAKEARRLEFTIAADDAECTVSSGFATAESAAEGRIAASAKTSLGGTLVAFEQIRAKAVTVATRVLSS